MPFNYTTPDWKPLERAASLTNNGPSVKRFMWMCEEPQGTHQYKHSDTRRYAILRADSTPQECVTEIRKALS